MARLSSTLALGIDDKVTGPARNIGRELDRLDRSVARVGERRQMMLSGASALAGIIPPAAIAAAGAATVRRFAEAELAVERIGITAGASADETKAAFGVIQKAAHDYAMTQDEVTAGLDTLVASGRDMKDALAFLPSVTATAQASGSAITDIASTADAIGRNFKVAGSDMQRAFDIIVEGGKAGQFELRDMASYLPSLAPSFAALGYEGEEGLKRMVAILQTLRAGSGSAEQAAAAAMNIFSKIESEETVNRFKKMGVDLRKEMASARKEGRDLLQVFVELTRETINGDLSKIPQLFGDQEMQIGMRAMINNGRVFTDVMQSLGRAAGSTGRDLERVLGTTQSKINQLSSSWDRFVQSLGAAVSVGAIPAMETFSNAVNSEIDYSAGMAREEAAGGSFGESFREYRRLYEEVHGKGLFNGAAIRTAYKEAMAAFGRGDIGSPYELIERERRRARGEGGVSREHKYALSGLDAAPSIDGARTTGRVPIPTAPQHQARPSTPNSEMTAAAQHRQYAAARTRADRATYRGPAPDFSSGGRGQSATLGNPDGFMSPEQRAYIEQRNRMAGIEPPPAPAPSPALQSALDQASATTRNFWGSAGKPDIAAPLAAEGAKAQSLAETIAAGIVQALSVTVAPIVDPGSIRAAMGDADALASKLRAIPGLAQAASDAAASARASYRQELDGLHADLSRAG